MESLFPEGLRVLVVDDDVTCLKVIGRMLQLCKYKVTSCNQPNDALTLLRKQRESFDLVITDIRMPGMDGFELLEHVELEINDLPVIMMSADSENETMMKCLSKGACFYLVKPVRIDQVMTIWQHVIRRKKEKTSSKDTDHDDDDVMISEELVEQKTKQVEVEAEKGEKEEGEGESSVHEGTGYNYNWKEEYSTKKRKEFVVKEEEKEVQINKKPRVLWSNELHDQFITAVNRIGIDRSVPKKILEFMKVPGLTRENIASHLQKYRIYLKRVEEATICAAMGTKPQNRLPIKSIFGSIPSQLIMPSNDHRFSGLSHHQIPHPPFAFNTYQSAAAAVARPPLLPPMNKMMMNNTPLLSFRTEQHQFHNNQLMYCYGNDRIGIGQSQIPANSSQLSIGVIQQSLSSFSTFNRNPKVNIQFNSGFSSNSTVNLENNSTGGLVDGSNRLQVPEFDPFDFLDGTDDFFGDPSEIDESRTLETDYITQTGQIDGVETVVTNHSRRGEDLDDGNISDVLKEFINFSENSGGDNDDDDGIDEFFQKEEENTEENRVDPDFVK